MTFKSNNTGKTSEKLHLTVPIALYRKLFDRANEERRSGHNMAIVLIEKGLETK